ncbi:DUF4956 domain-containing protein [Methanogenium marinum]|uniref:DUF4956 domain-containing protein n=1 Tax=Methanogenium marinum TaxID=348610 RepID=A0A9Q4KS96_9EURY|nr:DUF4956 domain-containing protein [Methanogenium marinum]MDE4907699.1 DUF4956 domain-containing protein [Methanogenium marinum]
MLSDTNLIFVLGFFINFLFAFIIIRFVYFPRQSEHTYLFTFLAFNTVIYFIMGLFTSIELSIGAGFGLFALFSVLRYRTETVPIHEMTYLFLMVALPVLNSILISSGQYEEMVLTNVLITGVIWALEKGWGFTSQMRSRDIVYEKIDLVHPDNREEMLADIRERTGLDVVRFEIGKIDYLRDTVNGRIYYREEPDKSGPRIQRK